MREGWGGEEMYKIREENCESLVPPVSLPRLPTNFYRSFYYIIRRENARL